MVEPKISPFDVVINGLREYELRIQELRLVLCNMSIKLFGTEHSEIIETNSLGAEKAEGKIPELFQQNLSLEDQLGKMESELSSFQDKL